LEGRKGKKLLPGITRSDLDNMPAVYAVPRNAYHFPQECLTAVDARHRIKALEK
jgi:hypothetical protein